MNLALDKANRDFFELRALAIAARALVQVSEWKTSDELCSALAFLNSLAEKAQQMAHDADVAALEFRSNQH